MSSRQSEQAIDLRVQRDKRRQEDAQAAEERRFAELLADVEGLVANSQERPTDVGAHVAELASAGFLNRGDLERLQEHVTQLAGGEFTEAAFSNPKVANDQPHVDTDALVSEWKASRRRLERSTTPNVFDVDPQRAHKTSELITQISGFLGLNDKEVQVRTDESAAQRTSARGARGLMDGGVVYLNPASYDPTTAEGRYLLGHEVVHLAQRPERGANNLQQISKTGAEQEAASLGRAFAAGRSITKPKIGLPAMDRAADTDATTTTDSATGGGGGGPPTDFRLSLAGQRFRIRIPSGSQPGRVTVRDLSISVGPLTISEAELRFKPDWSFDEGKVTGSIAAGTGINIDNVELDVNSELQVSAQLQGIEVELGTYISATMDLTIGSTGVSGRATIQPSDVHLPGDISFTGGQIDLSVSNGSMSANGNVTATVQGLGEIEFAAQFSSGGEEGASVSGEITLNLAQNLQVAEGVHLASTTITGTYSETDGFSTTGSVAVTVDGWATAEVEVGYSRSIEGTESWSANGRIEQAEPLTVGEGEQQLTLSGGWIELAFTDNEFQPIEAGGAFQHAHFHGDFTGTYEVATQQFAGSAQATLTNQITIGESGVVLKSLTGTATVAANALTTISVTELSAEIAYEDEPTFEITGTGTYLVPEQTYGGEGTVRTMRELTFGATTGLHGKIIEGSTATATVANNAITAITSAISFSAHEGEAELGAGSVTLNFAGGRAADAVSGEGNFTLTNALSFPDRATGPVTILAGASFGVSLAESVVQEISVADVGFEVTNWAGAGKVGGTFNGAWNVATNELNVSGQASVIEAWPITVPWGEVSFKEAGSGFEVVVVANEFEKFDGALPFEANLTVADQAIKIDGNLTGAYTKADELFNGSLEATLVENDLNIALGSGNDSIVIKADATTFGADITGSDLTTLRSTLGLEYLHAGELTLAGEITDGTIEVATGLVGFQGDLTLKKEIDQPLAGESGWKIVIPAESTTMNVTVAQSALERVGGDIQLQLYEGATPWLEGSVTDAEVDLETNEFTGDLSLTLMNPVEFPFGGQSELPAGIGLTMKAGSTVTGRIEANVFEEAGVELEFDVKKDTAPVATASLSGTWNLGTDKVTGTGTITLTDDVIFGDKANESGEPTAWALAFKNGAEVSLSMTESKLDQAQVDITIGLLRGNKDVAEGNVTGTYAFGDEAGFNGDISFNMIEDVHLLDAARFGVFLGGETNATGVITDSALASAEGSFILVAKEGDVAKANFTLGGSYEGGTFDGTATIAVLEPLRMGEHTTENGVWAVDLATNTGGSIEIVANEPGALSGTIAIDVLKDEAAFANGEFTASYDFSDEAAKIDAEGGFEITGEAVLGTVGDYTFKITGGTGIQASIVQNELMWIEGSLALGAAREAEGDIGTFTVSGKYTAGTEPDVSGEAEIALTAGFGLYDSGIYKFGFMPSTFGGTLTSGEITEAHGDITFKAEQLGGEDEAPLGTLIVNFDGDYTREVGATEGNFTGTGTCTVEGELVVGKAGDFEFIVTAGTEANLEIENNKFMRLWGDLRARVDNLQPRDGETPEFLALRCQASYVPTDGGKINARGAVGIIGRKHILGEGDYQFWLVPPEEAQVSAAAMVVIVDNELQRVHGMVSCAVYDGHPKPLIIAQAEGSWERETNLFNGGGSVKLGRDKTFPEPAAGAHLVFKEGSGGAGTVVNSEIRRLSGHLEVEVHDETGPLFSVDADGEYNAVDNDLVWAEGTAAILRPIEIGGVGDQALIRITSLVGSARVEHNELKAASGEISFELPRFKGATGTLSGGWTNASGEDEYWGAATIDFVLYDDPDTGRHLGGELHGNFERDGRWAVGGDVNYQINEIIGGNVHVEVDEKLDPVVDVAFTITDLPLVEGTTIFEKEMDLIPKMTTPLFYGINMFFGARAGMSLSTSDLLFSAEIGRNGWRPLADTTESGVPEFYADLNLSWGLDFRAMLGAYLGLSAGIPGLDAGMGLEGQVEMFVPVRINPSGHLEGGPSGFAGELDIGITIAPELIVRAVPFVQATAGPVSVEKRWEGIESNLGQLFKFEWGTKYAFGDVEGESASDPAANQAPEGASRDVESAGDVEPHYPTTTAAAAPARKGQPAIGAAPGRQTEEESAGSNSELDEKIEIITALAKGLSALGKIIGWISSILVGLIVAGPVGALVMLIIEIVFGDLSWDSLCEAADDLVRAGEVAWDLIEPQLDPAFRSIIADLKNGEAPDLMDALFGADDKVRDEVDAGTHRKLPPSGRAKFIDIMMDGVCGNADEDRILTIMRFSASKGDLASVLYDVDGGVDAILSALDWSQDDDARAILRRAGLSSDDAVARQLDSEGLTPSGAEIAAAMQEGGWDAVADLRASYSERRTASSIGPEALAEFEETQRLAVIAAAEEAEPPAVAEGEEEPWDPYGIAGDSGAPSEEMADLLEGVDMERERPVPEPARADAEAEAEDTDETVEATEGGSGAPSVESEAEVDSEGGTSGPQPDAVTGELAEETPEGGEDAGPSVDQLPSVEVLAGDGSYTVAWDASEPGENAFASAKLEGSGRLAGRIGQVVLPLLQAEAEAMDGPDGPVAVSDVNMAKTLIIGVNGRAGRYLRSEGTTAAQVRTGLMGFVRQLVHIISTVASVNGVDHAASEAAHQELAEEVAQRLSVPANPEHNYAEARTALEQAGTAEATAARGSLEENVELSLELAPATEDRVDRDLDFEVVIAPNTTRLQSTKDLAPLTADDALKTLDFQTFKTRFDALAATLSVPLTGDLSTAEAIWRAAFDILIARTSTVEDALTDDGQYLRLNSDEFREIMRDFDPIVRQLMGPVTEQISRMTTTNWAFWTGKPAQEVAQASGFVVLESTALGQLFDGLRIHPDDNFNMGLWGALSEAYTEHAINALEDGFDLHAFVAETAAEHGVFVNIEMRTLNASEPLGLNMTFYSVASMMSDRTKQPDMRFRGGGYRGTYDARSVNSGNAVAEMTKSAEEAERRNNARRTDPS